MEKINDDKQHIVGVYKQIYNDELSLKLKCDNIYQSDGLRAHVAKKHPLDTDYIERIPDIISNPDYIGANPKVKDSIEFIKCYEDNVLVAVKLDSAKDYLYVASLYNIKSSKIENRLHSGRIKKLGKSIDSTQQ